MIDVETVDAISTMALLSALEHQHADKAIIHVFLTMRDTIMRGWSKNGSIGRIVE